MSYSFNAIEGIFDLSGSGGGGGGGNAEKWTAVVDSTPVQMVKNGFYYINPGVSAILILPVTAKTGTRNRIAGGVGSFYTIQQNAGQKIVYADNSTAVGVDGQISALGSTALELLVTVEDNVWVAISGVDNPTLTTSVGVFNSTNPAAINGTGLVQYNNQQGNYNYTQGTAKGDLIAYNALTETWQKLTALSNQCFFVADSTQSLGWRTSTIQETADGEFLSGLGQVSAGPVVTNAAYSPLANAATGLVFPTADQAGLAANGALTFLARQFGVDSNVLHNIYGGMTWNYNEPGAYPYTVTGGNFVINVDTSSSSKTINLPNSSDFGRVFIVLDSTGNANSNPFTLTTPGGTVLIGGSTSKICSTAFGAFIVQWDGTRYNIISQPTAASEYSGYVVTTDDTPTVICTVPMVDEFSTYQFETRFVIYDETDQIGETSTITLGYRSETTATVHAIPNPDYIDSTEDPDVFYGIDFITSPGQVDITVTGIDLHTIRWRCVGTLLIV